MIAFDQSSPDEGHQDQYYVFCGQIAVKGGTGSSPIPADDQPTVRLPGAFKNGNISPKSLPTPLNLATSSGSAQDAKSTVRTKSVDTGGEDKKPADSSDSKDKSASSCADRCFKKKLTELKDLAPGCSADQFSCLCKSQNFIKGYQSCCNDHCQGIQETQAAVTEIYHKCGSAQPSSGSDDNPKADGASKPDGSSSVDDAKSGSNPKSQVKTQGLDSGSSSSTDATDSKPPASSKKLPSGCNGVCYRAKTTESELHHLAPTCKADDLDCLCRSHKWVCSYAACSNDNCPSSQEAQKATDEIYAICGARLAASSRGPQPTTDYIPVSANPSAATKAKSKTCAQTCLRKISAASACPSPDNLGCVCKSHADVCAWAKCAEDQCFDEVDAIRLASDDIYDQCKQ